VPLNDILAFFITKRLNPVNIQNDVVVSFHYTLLSIEGETLETSLDAEPALYLHGHRNIMPALEKALEGKTSGDELEVTLEPKDAYGERIEGRIQRVPIKHLANIPKRIRPGMAVQVNTENGVRSATVIKAGKFNVDVDTNHPLAGKALTFKITIVDLRDATADEIAHGHAHGPGGHHH
jgi:FKBP-type peptidyl-prolyl cis-trans isomerase SlyD